MIKPLPPHKNVYLAFFLYSFALGAIFPRLGDLQLQMQIGESALGLAIMGLPLGVQISLLFADKLTDKLGFKLILAMGLPALSVFLTLACYVLEPINFFLYLLFGGFVVGLLEVAVNLEADRVEYKLERRIMNRSHAFWSLGFFVSGFLGALMSQWEIVPFYHLLVFGSVSTFAVLVFLINYRPAKFRPNLKENNSLFVKPTPEILVLVVFTLSAMLVEGAGIDWSVIFMRDIFATPAAFNGLALAFGALSQFFVRYFADDLIEKHGSEKIARLSITLMLFGVFMVCFSQQAYIALIGFIFMGAGNAVLFPMAVSAAAQKTDRPAAVNVASLAQISFLTFLLAPPLLGFVAEHAGIRYAFGLCLPFLIFSWLTVPTIVMNKSN